MRDNGISEVNESDPWWMSRGPILNNCGLRTMPLDEEEDDDAPAANQANTNQATTTGTVDAPTTDSVPNPWAPNTSFSDLTKRRLSGVQRMEALVHDLEMRIVKSGKIRNVKDLKDDGFFNDAHSADEKEDADDEDFIDDGYSQNSGNNNDADEDDGGNDELIYDVSGFQACHPDASWPEAGTKKILTWHDRVSKLFVVVSSKDNDRSSGTNIDGLQPFGKNPPPREAITAALSDIFSRFPDNCDDEAEVAKMATQIREKLGSGLLRSKEGEWRWERSSYTKDGTSGDLPMPWIDEQEDVHWANFVLLCKIPLPIEVFVRAWLEAQQRSNLRGLAKWNAVIVNKCDTLSADNNPMVYRAFCEEDGILAPWIPIIRDLKDWYYRKTRLEVAFDRLPRWEYPSFTSSRSRETFIRSIRPLIRYCKWDVLSKVLDQMEGPHEGQMEQAEVEKLLPIQLPLRVEVPFSPDADVTVLEFRCPQSTRVKVSLQGQTTTYESLDEGIKKLWEQLVSQKKNAYRLKMNWPNTPTPWDREGVTPVGDAPVDSSHITPAWNLCRVIGEGKTVTLATVLYVALTSSRGIFPFSNPTETTTETTEKNDKSCGSRVENTDVGAGDILGAVAEDILDAGDAPTSCNLVAHTAPQIRIIDLDDETTSESIAGRQRSRSREGSRVIDSETRRRQSMLLKPEAYTDKGGLASEPVARSESVSASIELESNEDQDDVSASIGSDASDGSGTPVPPKSDEDEDEDASVSCDTDDSSPLIPERVKKETKIDAVDNDKKERKTSSGAHKNESSSTLSTGQGKESGGGESPQRGSRGKRPRSQEIADDEPPASPKSPMKSPPLQKSVTRASPMKSPARKKSATRESPMKSPPLQKSATRASPMKSPALQKSATRESPMKSPPLQKSVTRASPMKSPARQKSVAAEAKSSAAARRQSVSDTKKNPPKASTSASSNTQKKKSMAESKKRELSRQKSNPSKGSNNSSKSSKMKNLKSPMKTTKK